MATLFIAADVGGTNARMQLWSVAAGASELSAAELVASKTYFSGVF